MLYVPKRSSKRKLKYKTVKDVYFCYLCYEIVTFVVIQLVLVYDVLAVRCLCQKLTTSVENYAQLDLLTALGDN